MFSKIEGNLIWSIFTEDIILLFLLFSDLQPVCIKRYGADAKKIKTRSGVLTTFRGNTQLLQSIANR